MRWPFRALERLRPWVDGKQPRPSETKPRPTGNDPSRGSTISGSFAWTADPFFRPTVGVFVGGQLYAVSPTYRVRAPGQASGWSCGFTIEQTAWPAEQHDVELCCLETAEPVGSVAASGNQQRPKTLGVDDLIALAKTRTPVLDVSGFAAFLALPTSEQLSLVYQTVLGRGPDPAGALTYSSALHRGATILDIRDELMKSDEFRLGRMPSLSPPFGHWIVWAGLEKITRCLVTFAPDAQGGGHLSPVSSVPTSRGKAVPLDRHVGIDLARLALGGAASDMTIAAWLQDHSSAISGFSGAHHPKCEDPMSLPRASHRMSLGHLLGGMSVGDLGRRGKEQVVIRAGREGVVLYGPFVTLESGRYELLLSLDVSAPAGSADANLTFEVSLGSVVLAFVLIPVAARVADPVRLGFSVPASIAATAVAQIECRLLSDGKVDGQVMALTIDRVARGPEATAAPNVDDWLPMFTAGDAGSRAGAVIEGRAELSGQVLLGPRRALLPGSYSVAIAVIIGPSAVGPASVDVDVVDTELRVLASRAFPLSPDVNHLEVPFDVAPRSDGELPPSLEFRLRKPNGPALTVTGVTVRLHDRERPQEP